MMTPSASRFVTFVLLVLACAGCSSSVGPGDAADVGVSPDVVTVDARDVATTTDSATVCASDPGDGGAFTTFERTCTVDTDCTVVGHLGSCCGDTLYLGISNRCATAFGVAETVWVAAHPALCGCARPDETESGLTGFAPTSVAARCVAGQCVATTRETCGGQLCAPGQVCRTDACGGVCGLCPAVPVCAEIGDDCMHHPDCTCIGCPTTGCSSHMTVAQLDCRCGTR